MSDLETGLIGGGAALLVILIILAIIIICCYCRRDRLTHLTQPRSPTQSNNEGKLSTRRPPPPPPPSRPVAGPGPSRPRPLPSQPPGSSGRSEDGYYGIGSTQYDYAYETENTGYQRRGAHPPSHHYIELQSGNAYEMDSSDYRAGQSEHSTYSTNQSRNAASRNEQPASSTYRNEGHLNRAMQPPQMNQSEYTSSATNRLDNQAECADSTVYNYVPPEDGEAGNERPAGIDYRTGGYQNRAMQPPQTNRSESSSPATNRLDNPGDYADSTIYDYVPPDSGEGLEATSGM